MTHGMVTDSPTETLHPSVQVDVPDSSFGLGRLASLISSSATAKTIFGEPVRQGQNVAIPVAKTSWGMGGGRSGAEDGEGGGGGMHIAPVGFIHMNDKQVRFRKIRGPAAFIGATMVLIGSFILLDRAINQKRR